jgi:hypothetical protein
MELAAPGAAFDFIFLHREHLAAGAGNFNLGHQRLPLFLKKYQPYNLTSGKTGSKCLEKRASCPKGFYAVRFS